MSRRIALSLALTAVASLALASSASAFHLTRFDVTYTNENGTPATQAGSHPWAMTTKVEFSTKPDPKNPGREIGEGSPKNVSVELPAGVVGNRDAVPHCSNVDFLQKELVPGNEFPVSHCPNDTAVGVMRVLAPGEPLSDPEPGTNLTAIYNLNAPPGVAAKLGFIFLNVPIALSVRVNPAYPHNLIGTLENTSDIEPVGASELTLWGNPSSPLHDLQRGQCLGNENPISCETDEDEEAFLTLPRSCEGPLSAAYRANSWEEPGTFVAGPSEGALVVTGCDEIGFAATTQANPTTNQAESATGLDFNLDIDDPGMLDPAKRALSDIRKTIVTLPEGMTVNPGVSAGLEACSPAQFAGETLDSQPPQGCPQASKLGNVEVETPLLDKEVVQGQVFTATQDDNPFNSLIAAYMVIRDRDLGLLVKQAGKIIPDPRTGQLTTTFGEPGQEIPQFPFSHFRFHFRSTAPAPLVTPPTCGSFTATADFSPWANPAAIFPTASSFPISQGVGGGPCPQGTLPFKPGFEAGSTNDRAGAYSPFNVRLTRNDGEQEGTRFDAILPPGVIAKLASVPKCPDSAVAAAKGKTGRQELASPSCPAATQVGRTIGGAGVGSPLTYVPGSVYLAGPFGGDPFSIIAITPAVAGPFDAGTVVVRQGLQVNPTTFLAEADGSHADPIPHILKGIPLKLRDLRVYVDRPDFTLNPTNCEPHATTATIFGSAADVFSPNDDVGVPVSSPYQASRCAELKFRPSLALSLKGGTKRNDHPALTATLTYPKGAGYANIGKAVTKLPPSEFIDNAHIQNPCTRVQFAANSCPKGSILGTAKATTPLLDKPLEGPVYFRSNGGERLLPDVVADLNGEVHITVVGKVDSVKGRIRTTFDQVPDAPVSTFTLSLYGGKRGLLVNSRNLCSADLKADVKLTGQNNRPYDTRPVVGTSCKKGKKQGTKGSKGTK